MGGKLSLEPQNAPEYRPVVGTKCATYLSLRARGDNSLQLLLGLETDNIVVSIAENPFKEEGVDPSLQASLKGMSQRASTNHPPPSMNSFMTLLLLPPPPPPPRRLLHLIHTPPRSGVLGTPSRLMHVRLPNVDGRYVHCQPLELQVSSRIGFI
jgi:hypothetical protein